MTGPSSSLPPVAFAAAGMEPLRLARSARRHGLSAFVDGDRILVRGREETIAAWAKAAHRRVGAEPLPPAEMGITPETTQPGALAAILSEGLTKWRKRAAAGPLDAVMIHKIRVQLRRIRAGISLLGDPANAAEQALREQARAFASAMGPAREIDVCLAETLPEAEAAMHRPGRLAALAEALAEARTAEYRTVRDLLAGPDSFALQLALVQHASLLAVSSGPALREIAPRLIAERVAKLKRRGRSLAAMESVPRHRLRIGVKKLRYLIEFLAPLVPRKPALRFTADLAALQDRLGRLNDAATLEEMLSRLALTDRFESGLLIGWLEARPAGLGKLERRWRRTLESEDFWSAGVE